MKYHLLFNGLGSGNIGDEAMMHGFLSGYLLPEGTPIEVWDNSAPVLTQFPSRYNYINYQEEDAYKKACLAADAVLVVGDTPVNEKWGLDWPLIALNSKLGPCHKNGIPCHAVGVGVDLLKTEDGKRLFVKGFLPISSWTVRSFRSRRNLIALGVDSKRIRVAADLAWLMPFNVDREWASIFLAGLGVRRDVPVLGVNVVNEIWKDNYAIKREVAKALDAVIGDLGWQVVFFCNETREGDYYDKEASIQVASLMKNKAIVVPNNYFTPQEMISLLSCCLMTLSWRYHFTLFSYLAGTTPISVIRGEKLQELVEDTGGESIGQPEEISSSMIVEKLVYVHKRIDKIRVLQEVTSDIMRLRSRLNFNFIKSNGCDRLLQKIEPNYKLATVDEFRSDRFVAFMKAINLFAKRFGLRDFTDCTKVWEYPWLWFNGLSNVNWLNVKLLDMGSELSPMPWFLASLGARVTLTESNAQWIPVWEQIRRETGLPVGWHIVRSEIMPFEDSTFDVITSFSVVEHQKDKLLAVNEIARALKADGLLAISFDVCETGRGMAFPEWSGKALTMAGFEEIVWKHPQFDNGGNKPAWNVEDIPEFINWNLQSAPQHNYTVGAAMLKKKLLIPERIRKILVPRFDTSGDIVLLEGFLEALLEKFPDSQIALLVREGYDQLASLFPERLLWLTTSLNPYKAMDDKEIEKLSDSLDKIAGDGWDLLLTTTYNRTWLDDAVAAKLANTVKIALGPEKESDAWQRRLFERAKLHTAKLYDLLVPVDEHLHETEKYRILWENLFKDNRKLSLPKLGITKEFENKALTILPGLGLEDRKFFICAPAGTQNVPVKAWPVERFAEAALWVTREFGLHPLIVCHESEQAVTGVLSEMLEEKGISCSLWIGKDGEIPVLAAIMHKASFYLGNDTGPMHIAAALGVPVIGIFGGGTWPRFLPAEDRSVAVAGELPCFGCMWDCIFQDAPCMRLVSVEDLKEAVRIILEKRNTKSEVLRSSRKINSETAEFIEKAVSRFSSVSLNYSRRLEESEADRAARLEVIHKLGAQLEESEADRAARLEVIHKLGAQLEASEADRAARLEVIHKLGAQLEASEADRAARLEVIHKLGAQLEESEADRAARLEVIHKLGAQLEESEADRAARLEKIELDRVLIERLRKELEAMHKSLTWRATGSLRGIFDKLKSSY